MVKSEAPNLNQSKRGHLPRWLTPTGLAAAFLLIHIMAPWRLSLLGTRHGWAGRRPGVWNRLALILIAPCVTGTIWMITQHYRASPDTFLDLQPSKKLITPGLYAFSRNPMYLLELTFWLGWALFYGSIPVLLGFLLWFVMFNLMIVPFEERDLERRFGDAYRQYKTVVPRWLGKI